MTIGEQDKKLYETWKLALVTFIAMNRVDNTHKKNWFIGTSFTEMQHTSHHKQMDILAIRIKKMNRKEDVKFKKNYLYRGKKGVTKVASPIVLSLHFTINVNI